MESQGGNFVLIYGSVIKSKLDGLVGRVVDL